MTVLVPTMGALHKGHQALIKRARSLSKEVVVSIFINPLQFENKDDLEKYPRSPEKDIQLATLAGATEIWLPEYEEIYPGDISKLSAGPLGQIFEGKSRPEHFDGVVTVVNRLFEIVKPTTAVFGEKDFQQLAIIKAMKSKVEIIGVPTVREFDGLALSSRNIRLTEQGRVSANVIHRALAAAHLAPTVAIAQEIIDTTLATEPAFKCDYAAIIDENSFEFANETTKHKRAIIAGWIDGVRLIDNMRMGEGR
jgi:pantoate--beta-alanine ligase